MTASLPNVPPIHLSIPLVHGFADDFDRAPELYKVANTDANLIFGLMDADAETLPTSQCGRNYKS